MLITLINTSRTWSRPRKSQMCCQGRHNSWGEGALEEWRAENCLNKPSKDWNKMVLVTSVVSEGNPSARDTFGKRCGTWESAGVYIRHCAWDRNRLLLENKELDRQNIQKKYENVCLAERYHSMDWWGNRSLQNIEKTSQRFRRKTCGVYHHGGALQELHHRRWKQARLINTTRIKNCLLY